MAPPWSSHVVRGKMARSEKRMASGKGICTKGSCFPSLSGHPGAMTKFPVCRALEEFTDLSPGLGVGNILFLSNLLSLPILARKSLLAMLPYKLFLQDLQPFLCFKSNILLRPNRAIYRICASKLSYKRLFSSSRWITVGGRLVSKNTDCNSILLPLRIHLGKSGRLVKKIYRPITMGLYWKTLCKQTLQWVYLPSWRIVVFFFTQDAKISLLPVIPAVATKQGICPQPAKLDLLNCDCKCLFRSWCTPLSPSIPVITTNTVLMPFSSPHLLCCYLKHKTCRKPSSSVWAHLLRTGLETTPLAYSLWFYGEFDNNVIVCPCSYQRTPLHFPGVCMRYFKTSHWLEPSQANHDQMVK